MLNIAEVIVISILFDTTIFWWHMRKVKWGRGEVTSSAAGQLSAAESPQRVSWLSWSTTIPVTTILLCGVVVTTNQGYLIGRDEAGRN